MGVSYVYFVSYIGSGVTGRCHVICPTPVTTIDDVEAMERAIAANNPKVQSPLIMNYQLMRVDGYGD